MSYNTNKYGEILNGPDTFVTAAQDLAKHGSVSLAWIDGEGTMLTVVLSRPVTPPLTIDATRSRLVVGVIGYGTYPFTAATEATYVSEKLRIRALPTARHLADLINGVLHHSYAQVTTT